MSKIIELSLAKNYVSSWGVEDAIRELIANALDTGSEYIDLGEDYITIETNSGAIPIKHLLMGSGTKNCNTDTIGQFNEGLKLALLILCRNNLDIEILNGSESWTPYIAKSETFDEDCLHIDIGENTFDNQSNKVSFFVKGLTSDVVEILKERHLYFHEDRDVIQTTKGEILLDPQFKGQMFCGGIWVASDRNFDYGYNFNVDVLKLDRDRKSVSTFDISWQTKEMWANINSEDEKERSTLVNNLISEKQDSYYLRSSSTRVSKKVANDLLDKLNEQNDEETLYTGDLSEYDKLKQDKSNKVKYINNENLISVIRMADNYKDPKMKIVDINPYQILEGFYEEWNSSMSSDLDEAYVEMLQKLKNII